MIVEQVNQLVRLRLLTKDEAIELFQDTLSETNPDPACSLPPAVLVKHQVGIKALRVLSAPLHTILRKAAFGVPITCANCIHFNRQSWPDGEEQLGGDCTVLLRIMKILNAGLSFVPYLYIYDNFGCILGEEKNHASSF